MTDKTPVAWRVKDYADGWILQEDLSASVREFYETDGHIVERLYSETYVRTLEEENSNLRKALTKAAASRLRDLIEWLKENEDNAALLLSVLTPEQIEEVRSALQSKSTEESK